MTKELKKGKGQHVPFNEKSIKKKLSVLGTEPKPSKKSMESKGFKKDAKGDWVKK